MARLPIATRESIPEEQRQIFDEMVGRLGSVPQHGPGSIMIHTPSAHRWATGLNDYLRNDSTLPKKVQELAMLVTARELDCQHIWNAHAGSARSSGLADAKVDALRDRKELTGLSTDETAVVQFGQEMLRNRRVSRGAFQAALEELGVQGVVELALLIGNYAMLAYAVNAFDTDLIPERAEPLLPV